MGAQKRRWKQLPKAVWHGIISNTVYDIMKQILIALWLLVVGLPLSLVQRVLGAAIPAVRDALSIEIVLIVGTISTAVLLWLLLDFTAKKTPWQVPADRRRNLFILVILIIFFIISCLVLRPWLISLDRHALGTAIPTARDALSIEVVLTVGTISTALVLWFLAGFIFAGLIITVFNKIRWHWGRVRPILKPQTINTKQVLVEGCQSLLILIILIIFIIVGIFLFGAASFFGWEKVISFIASTTQLIIRQLI